MTMIGMSRPAAGDGLRRAIAVAACVTTPTMSSGRRGQDARHGPLRHVLRPVAMDRARDGELRELLHARMDARADLVVHEDAGEAADLEEVAALGQAAARYSTCLRPISRKSTAMR
jgi:hypothetical protein